MERKTASSRAIVHAKRHSCFLQRESRKKKESHTHTHTQQYKNIATNSRTFYVHIQEEGREFSRASRCFPDASRPVVELWPRKKKKKKSFVAKTSFKGITLQLLKAEVKRKKKKDASSWFLPLYTNRIMSSIISL